MLKTNPRTLLRHWPEPRSTSELDLFLRTELLTDSSRLMPLLKALGKLGYRPVETARYYQFFKPGPGGGEAITPTVFLPHPFTFIMMKLFALRDRINDPEKDYGRHHALDLYSIVAMMTEDEWRVALDLHRKYRADAKIVEAGELVAALFGNLFSRGVLRLKESPYYRDEFELAEFLEAMRDLFT